MTFLIVPSLPAASMPWRTTRTARFASAHSRSCSSVSRSSCSAVWASAASLSMPWVVAGIDGRKADPMTRFDEQSRAKILHRRIVARRVTGVARRTGPPATRRYHRLRRSSRRPRYPTDDHRRRRQAPSDLPRRALGGVARSARRREPGRSRRRRPARRSTRPRPSTRRRSRRRSPPSRSRATCPPTSAAASFARSAPGSRRVARSWDGSSPSRRASRSATRSSRSTGPSSRSGSAPRRPSG